MPQNLHHDGRQVFVKVQAEDQRTDHARVVGATPQSQNGLDERGVFLLPAQLDVDADCCDPIRHRCDGPQSGASVLRSAGASATLDTEITRRHWIDGRLTAGVGITVPSVDQTRFMAVKARDSQPQAGRPVPSMLRFNPQSKRATLHHTICFECVILIRQIYLIVSKRDQKKHDRFF